MLAAGRVLYVAVCAAPPANKVGVLVDLAHADGWDVCVVTTPNALNFLDVPKLQGQTGHPVRSDYKGPGEPDVLPVPTAIIVAPATFNTMNKWALRISDTLVLGLLTEGIGKGLPLVAMPFSIVPKLLTPPLTEASRRCAWGGPCSVWA